MEKWLSGTGVLCRRVNKIAKWSKWSTTRRGRMVMVTDDVFPSRSIYCYPNAGAALLDSDPFYYGNFIKITGVAIPPLFLHCWLHH